MDSTPFKQITRPYPGLRPFRQNEAPIFFGREAHVDALLERLHDHRFVAVVGASGAGKSSLVRAGLLPALQSGLLADIGGKWLIAEMRPRGRLIAELAKYLARVLEPHLGEESRKGFAEFAESELRRGRVGLRNVYDAAKLPPHTNLLVLVDQFEEIFRREQVDPEEADAFVNLLLESSQHPAIYIVITMRSDNLGDCIRFDGLPEVISESQYLTPRLTREQLREAIAKPALLFNGEIEPQLVTRLINELDRDQDELPLLQHALLRMWLHARDRQPNGERVIVNEDQDYAHFGNVSKALSDHADQVFNGLANDEQRRLAERMFRCLTDAGVGKRDTRRPLPLGELADSVGCDWKQLIPVIDAFRAQECHFLVPKPKDELSCDTFIDISHESFIRHWTKLRHDWLQLETQAAGNYRELAQRSGFQSPLSELDLSRLGGWWAKEKPTLAWARRYATDPDKHEEEYGRIEKYLVESGKAVEDEKEARRAGKLKLKILIALVAVLLIGLAGIFFLNELDVQRVRAEAANETARKETEKARLEEKLKQDEHEVAKRFRGRDLIGDAKRLVESENDPALATRLAVVAANLSATDDVKTGVLQAVHAASGLSVTFEGHTQEVRALAIGKAGKTLFTGSFDKTIRFWDLETGFETRKIDAGVAPYSIALSPDEKTLAYGGDNGKVFLQDVIGSHQAELLFDAGADRIIYALAFSPDGRLASSDGYIASKDARVIIWDVSARKPLNELPAKQQHGGPALVIAFNPAKNHPAQLATGGVDGRVVLWDIEKSKQIAHTEARSGQQVFSLAFDDKGKKIAFGTNTGAIALHAASSLKKLDEATDKHDKRAIFGLAFAPDGKTLATSGMDKSLILWNASETKLEQSSKRSTYGDAILKLAFLQKGNVLVAAGASGQIYLMNQDSQQSHAIAGQLGRWKQIALSPNSSLVALAADSEVVLWDSAKDAPVKHEEKEKVTALTFDVSGTRLIYGTKDRNIVIRDANSWKETFRLPAGETTLTKIVAQRNKDSLISLDETGTIKRWDLATGTSEILSKDSGRPESSGNGKWAAWLKAKNVVIYDFHAKKSWPIPEAFNERVTSIAFSSDGRILAKGYNDASIRLWDIENNKPKDMFFRGGHKTGAILSLAFSPDGKSLVSAGDDGSIILWSLELQRPMAELRNTHRAGTNVELDLTFSADGKRLFSRDQEGVVMWDIDPNSVNGAACRIAGRDLNDRERKRFEVSEDESRDLCVLWMWKEAHEKARNGDKKAAESGYTKASQKAVDTKDARDANGVCWHGSLDGYATVVLPACKAAVRYADEKIRGPYRDSLGVASALAASKAVVSDYSGAIQEFEQFLKWGKDQQAKSKAPELAAKWQPYLQMREEWLVQLRQGVNPITPEVLNTLQTEVCPCE